MAVEGPNPKTFQSWEEAFLHPIPTVRGMERQLRNDISSNREKLRTLVGASYRSLLGTAESIIKMDSQMSTVETLLGELGAKCNSKLLEKKTVNLQAWDSTVNTRDRERYALTSQMAVLRSCPDVISALLRRGGSTLLAAKVLVISRLLHKKLSQLSNPPLFLETLRNRLGALRRRTLTRVDVELQSFNTSGEALVEAMCAFSLATSSSLTDVLRHFHHVRLEAMSELGQFSGDPEGTFKALRLFLKTLKETQAIFPTQLARALESLKTSPLLKSPDIFSLWELSLDIHGKWLGDDIRSFIPYIRHDDLQRAEAGRLLKQWAKQAFFSFLEQLQRRTESLVDVLEIVQLRQSMLEFWLSNRRHVVAIDTSEVLDGLRDAFNRRLIQLLRENVVDLRSVASLTEDILNKWQVDGSNIRPSMWNVSTTSIDAVSGGQVLKETLASRFYGKNWTTTAIFKKYKTWVNRVEETDQVIKRLRESKWINNLDNFDDDDDDILEDKQVLLSEDDPHFLQAELQRSLQMAFEDFQKTMGVMMQAIESDSTGQKAEFLLRVWRDVRQHLPYMYKDSRIGFDTIQRLQTKVAEKAIAAPISRCEKRIRRTPHPGKKPPRLLWEGDPALPVLPSSWAFRLLYDLIASMNIQGSDIWSAQAILILKYLLREKLAVFLGEVPELRQEAQANGHEEIDNIRAEGPNGEITDKERLSSNETDGKSLSDGNEDAHNTETEKLLPETFVEDERIQRLFDICYLQNATATREGDSKERGMTEILNSVKESTQLSSGSIVSIQKVAEEYWRRTSLLFALLA
ncbi:MAG: hypothetical protein Q9167_005799 [Letrouitia subvulpina]